MDDIEIIEGDFSAVCGRYAIVAARFNNYVVESLLQGALDTLRRHGVTGTQIYRVPGALEIPLVVDKLAAAGGHDAIIALGAVVRGSTPHFDIVASESASGLSRSMQQHGIPVINGILTTDTVEQAIERAGTKNGNKGADAAAAAMEMVSLLNKMG